MASMLLISVIFLVIGVNSFIGAIVYIRNPKSQINRAVAAIALLFALWSIFLLLYQYPLMGDSEAWIKTVYLTIVILISTVFYFSFIFPRPVFEEVKYSAAFYACFYIFFSVYLLFFTKRWVADVIVLENGIVHTVLGRGYIWWVMLTWGMLLWAVINLIINGGKQNGLAKIQIKYLMMGFLLWGLFVNLPDVIWPLLFNDTQYFAYSSISSIFFSVAVAYIILRHRFLDIRLIIARSITYLLLILIMGALYTSGLYLLSSLFLGHEQKSTDVMASTILALIIAFTFQPLRHALDRLTDKFFYRERYETAILLSQLGRMMASTITVEDLVTLTFKELEEKMHIPFAGMHLLKNGSTYLKKWVNKDHINDTQVEKLANYFTRIYDRKVLVFEEMEESWEKDVMRENDFGIIIPFRVDSTMVGIVVFGQKLSGDIYTMQDIDVMEVFAPEMIVSLRNALSYEEIKNFNITLKQEVARATEKLQKANDQLKELDHMKDEFVSVASHELRTPMTAIRSYLWLALQGKGGPLSDKQKMYLDRSYNSTVRLIKLVNDMLNISRIESGRMSFEMGMVDIVSLTEEIIGEIKPKADELGVTLELLPELKIGGLYKNVHSAYNPETREKKILDNLRQHIAGAKTPAAEDHAVPMVIADADKIKEVVMNLIGNALKFTPAGGKVKISFEVKGERVVVRVTDTGIGIAQSDLSKLFQKFGMIKGSYTTNQTASQGTGLGLYICKQILKLHEGDIWVESEGKGRGTIFGFSLLAYNPDKCRELNASRKGVEGMGIIHSEI